MLRPLTTTLARRLSTARPTVRRLSTARQPVSAANAVDLRPIAHGPSHFGREVVGIDLASQTLPEDQLVSALYEHGLLLFRNQEHLTPDDEMRFAELFTHQPDDTNQSYTGGAGTQHRLPEYPSIALVGSYEVRDFYGLSASSPGVYNGWHPEQRAWHCDGLADTSPPPDLTTMRCVITPESGGETLFACTVRAAELLPASLDPPPEEVSVHYQLFADYDVAREGTHLTRAAGAKGESAEAGWDVNLTGGTNVPLVCRERVSGKKALVGSYHVSSLTAGARTLDFDAANRYLAAAWAPGLDESLLLKHQWRVGDLVAWSNRLVIHTATSTAPYAGQDRLHTRIRMRSAPEHSPTAWRAGGHE